jgi:excisionase family DNA binding protein
LDSSALTISISDAVCRTGIGRTSMFNAIREGRLRAIKFGGRTLIRLDDLRAFINDLPARRTARAFPAISLPGREDTDSKTPVPPVGSLRRR